ncbi:inositol monophosphatase [bacterium]|nr:inositol monophosphatase [bacterium]
MEKDGFLKAAQDAARKAGKKLKEGIRSSTHVYYKGQLDLVTDLDKQSQNTVFNHLSSCFPGHDFLAEEGLSREKGAEYRWIIDPLDGTTNYAHKFPIFCVSIALAHKEELELGVVFDPLREEMFEAVKGKGAFLNGKKIGVSSVSYLDKSLVATGFPYDLRESEVNNINHFNNFLLRVQAIRRCGSAALDLCYVACGRFDGFWELKLKPWDVAAGILMVREAGGKVSDFRGGPWNLYGSQFLSSNGLIHGEMIEVLQKERE